MLSASKVWSTLGQIEHGDCLSSKRWEEPTYFRHSLDIFMSSKSSGLASFDPNFENTRISHLGRITSSSLRAASRMHEAPNLDYKYADGLSSKGLIRPRRF